MHSWDEADVSACAIDRNNTDIHPFLARVRSEYGNTRAFAAP